MIGSAYEPRHRRANSRSSRRVVRRVGAATAVLALQIVPLGAGGTPAVADTHLLASLPTVSSAAVVDSTHRWFYEGTGVGEQLRVRNIDTLKVVREGTPIAAPTKANTASPVTVVDEAHGRFMVLYYAGVDAARAATIDGASLKVLSDVPVTPPAGAAGGGAWTVRGATFQPRTGDLLVAWTVTSPYNPGSAHAVLYVSEVDPRTGASRWGERIPGCTDFVGSRTPVGYGRGSDSVYVACTAYPGSVSTVGGNRTSVVRLNQDAPGKAPAKVEQFQVPGSLRAANFAFVSERMYLQSASAYAQGMLVFDGLHSKTIGLIPGASLGEPGIDQRTGRMYSCANSYGLLVADAGRATPVPLGDQFPSIKCAAYVQPVVDPVSRKVFAVAADGSRWQVIKDEVPAYVPPPDEDPDAQTIDRPEQAGVTAATYTGGGSAYGSQTVLVGGPTGTEENLAGGYLYQLAVTVNQGTYVNTCKGQSPLGCLAVNVPNQGYANREIWRSRVAKAHLENAGASIAAAAATDRNNYVDTDLRAAENPQVVGEKPNASLPENKWPDERVACQDFATKNDSHTTDGASASCVSGSKVVGDARDTRRAPDGTGALFTVGSTAAHVEVERTAKGLVSTATAEARNVTLGGGLVRIASVRHSVTSMAHGRPGTAKTLVDTSEISGVVVLSPTGKPVFTCRTAEACDNDSAGLVTAINNALGNRVVVTLPNPDAPTLASRRGAQALYVRDRWEQLEEQTLNGTPPDDQAVPALEVQFIGDNLGQSRLLLKLAGVQLESHYAISQLPQGVDFDDHDDDQDTVQPTTPPTAAPSIAPTTGPGGDGAGDTPKPPPTAAPKASGPLATVLEKVRTGMRWVFGAGDGFLLRLSAWGLLLVPAYVGIRRRAYYRRALTAVAR